MENDPEERERLLTIVIVGGGPTGVEMAGAIAELARRALAADFRTIDPRHTRVLLIEAGPRLLPTFPEDLSRYAERALRSLGVEVWLGRAITGCDAAGVTLREERLPAGTVIWAAGVAASPAAAWLGVEADCAGRVKVGARLTLPGSDDVFVIGDTALVLDGNGEPLPATTPSPSAGTTVTARGSTRSSTCGPSVSAAQPGLWKMSEVLPVDPTTTIRAETSQADPDTCKFTVSRTVHPGGPFFFDSKDRASGSPLVERLFALPGVSHVLVAETVVTVGKDPSVAWSALKSAIGATIRTQLLTGVPAVYNTFNIQRHLISRRTLRQFRSDATNAWRTVALIA